LTETNWRKSTYSGGSGGQCVEVASWRKSTYSGGSGGECVEVASTPAHVAVRDTTNRDGGALTFTADAWAAFTTTLR
jgi:hypothetical protein